jgi:hypothetical protein
MKHAAAVFLIAEYALVRHRAIASSEVSRTASSVWGSLAIRALTGSRAFAGVAAPAMVGPGG